MVRFRAGIPLGFLPDVPEGSVVPRFSEYSPCNKCVQPGSLSSVFLMMVAGTAVRGSSGLSAQKELICDITVANIGGIPPPSPPRVSPSSQVLFSGPKLPATGVKDDEE